jgi:hypothetical protein
MHKTQGLGGFTSRVGNGPNLQSFMLLTGEPALPGAPTRTNTGLAATSNGAPDLMDDIDTTWARVPGGAEIGQLADEAIAQFQPTDPAASVNALLAIHAKLAALPTDPLVADKRTQLDRIIQSCLGLEVATTVDRPEVVPGEKLRVTVTTRVVRAGGKSITHVNAPDGQSTLKPGQPDTHASELTTPTDLPLTQPYWLHEEGTAGVAHVSDSTLIGRPESPPTLAVRHEFAIDGERIFIDDEPVHLTRDKQGEHRRRLDVIPPVSLAFNSELFVVPPGTSKDVTVEVTAARADSGVLRLEAPAGWKVVPSTQNFHLANAGDKARLSFRVTAPTEPTAGHFTALAEIGGKRYSNQRYEIRYSHIPGQLLQPPARVRVASFPLETRGFTIGYVPGAGDSVAECLEQMGYVVHRLAGVDLTPERLKGIDAVVFGVRAFNERDDLKAALPGLFAWVEAGGTVITQYNRPNGLKAETLGPYPLSIEGPAPQLRVTDENAPVTFLAPDDSSLNAPNKITAADFAGWVQECGTYFPSKWDEAHYTPILAMNDPGEAPLKSSLLIARHGKGYYVYTGLTFFRQLPAGVSGAYRLFANLISLGK